MRRRGSVRSGPRTTRPRCACRSTRSPRRSSPGRPWTNTSRRLYKRQCVTGAPTKGVSVGAARACQGRHDGAVISTEPGGLMPKKIAVLLVHGVEAAGEELTDTAEKLMAAAFAEV